MKKPLYHKYVICLTDTDENYATDIDLTLLPDVVSDMGGILLFNFSFDMSQAMSGSVPLDVQDNIIKFAKRYGIENIVVLINGTERSAVEMMATTVTAGDVTYAGSLTELSLGLGVYHILENSLFLDGIAGWYSGDWSDFYRSSEGDIGQLDCIADVIDIRSDYSVYSYNVFGDQVYPGVTEFYPGEEFSTIYITPFKQVYLGTNKIGLLYLGSNNVQICNN